MSRKIIGDVVYEIHRPRTSDPFVSVVEAFDNDLLVAHIEEFVDDLPVCEIESEAFAGCEKLEEVVLPPTVDLIGSGAFSGCIALESVIISGVKIEIERDAFWNCKNLQTVYSTGRIMLTGKLAFGRCTNLFNFVGKISGFLNGSNFINCPQLTALQFADDVRFDVAAFDRSNIVDLYFKGKVDTNKLDVSIFQGKTVHCTEKFNLLELAFQGVNVVLDA